MAITRIQNNQITDSTINAQYKLLAGSITGNLFAPSVTLNSNVTINGNLFLSNAGNVTTINATNTYINDPLVMFNNGYTGSLTGYDIGILVNRNLAALGAYGSVNTFLGWVESDSAFETLATTDTGTGITSINNSGYANFKTGNATMVSGTVTGTLAVTGATTLTTATAGGIQAVAIGNATPGTGAFTTLSTTGNLTVGGNIAITGNIVPSANVTYSLGTLNSRFKDIFLSGSTIYAGGFVISEETSGNLNLTANNGNRLQILGTAANVIQATGNVVAPFHLGSLVGASATITTSANITGTGASTTSTTGALVVMGGAGVAGQIYAGGIQNTPIGATTASTAAFTTATAGGLQAVAIGNATPGTAAFTTLTASGATTLTNATESTTAGTGALIVTGGVGIAKNLNVTGSATIGGNLTVTGTLTAIQSTTLDVSDLNITVAKGAASAAAANGAGLTVDGASATILYTNATDTWNFNKGIVGTSTTMNSGNIGGLQVVAIGNITPGTAAFTTGTFSSTLGVTGATTMTTATVGGLQAVAIGNATPGTGAFTTLSTSGQLSPSSLAVTNNATVGGTLGVTGSTTLAAVGATNITASGTLGVTGATTMTTASTGGLQAVAIGNATPGTGAFTTLTSSGTTIASGNIVAASNTASTSATTGALVIAGTGGLAVGGNSFHAGSTILNSSQTAGFDTIIRGKNDATLLWARPNATYDTVIIGNSATASTYVGGSKLNINTTDTIMLPVGTTAQRPSSVGFSDVTGMFRFSTTVGAIEWYNGTAWAAASTSFTLIADQQFSGTGSQTAFTLTEAQTTNSCIVSINGVVQIPTLAYAVTGGTTLTFTEAPASGEVIDVRKLTTTTTVTNITSTNGYMGFSADNSGAYVNVGASSTSVATYWDTAGSKVSALANTAVASANTATTIDTMATGTYRSAKYIIQATNGANYQAMEALMISNGTTATVLAYGTVQTAGNLGIVTATQSGSNALLQFVAANSSTNVRITKDYLLI
jgi:hypothetical protein